MEVVVVKEGFAICHCATAHTARKKRRKKQERERGRERENKMVEQQNSSLLTCAAASRDVGSFLIKPENFCSHLLTSQCLMQFRGKPHGYLSSDTEEDYCHLKYIHIIRLTWIQSPNRNIMLITPLGRPRSVPTVLLRVHEVTVQ